MAPTSRRLWLSGDVASDAVYPATAERAVITVERAVVVRFGGIFGPLDGDIGTVGEGVGGISAGQDSSGYRLYRRDTYVCSIRLTGF